MPPMRLTPLVVSLFLCTALNAADTPVIIDLGAAPAAEPVHRDTVEHRRRCEGP